MTEKLKVDMNDLTLRELAEVGKALAPQSMTDALSGPEQPRAIAVIAWVIAQRDNPAFTLEEALDLRMGDIDFVGAETPGEVQGANDGATPPISLAPGTSTRSA